MAVLAAHDQERRSWSVGRTKNQGPRTKDVPVLLAVLVAKDQGPRTKDLSVLLAVLAA